MTKTVQASACSIPDASLGLGSLVMKILLKQPFLFHYRSSDQAVGSVIFYTLIFFNGTIIVFDNCTLFMTNILKCR